MKVHNTKPLQIFPFSTLIMELMLAPATSFPNLVIILSLSLSPSRMAVSFLTAFSRRAPWTILRLYGYARTSGYSGVAGVDHNWFVLLWAYEFLEYTDTEASKFASAPGPFEDRGEMAMACASRCCLLTRHIG